MPTTIHFATNRLITGDATKVESYSADLVTPSDPGWRHTAQLGCKRSERRSEDEEPASAL
jgi:hypothetical protein